MADDRIRQDPDELDLDDEFMDDEGGGIAELPADEEAEEIDEDEE